ncbi:3-dehydroquinate synthase [Chloroflexota bacterium]
MRNIEVKLGVNSYQVHIGHGILPRLGSWLRQSGTADKLAIITNPSVKRLYGETLEQHLTQEGFAVTTLLVPEGEEQKSLETAGGLYRGLADFRAERTTPIIALGGGVIGDLAGFVAATYLRGLPLVQVPTTLLAQVDSSIGGKVAVDYDQLKNQIGAFYQPRLVVSDIATLSTLPAEELGDGLAEVIKYGVIADKGLFAYLEENLDQIKSFDSITLEEIVFRSARIKARVVEKDERDLGLRNILNYGHTVGHAIETVSGLTVGHGPAVAIGMVIAGRISNRLGLFSHEEQSRLERLIQRAGLPTESPVPDISGIIRAMAHDKKIRNGRIRFVLPKSIGKVFVTDEVTPALVEQVLVGGYEQT